MSAAAEDTDGWDDYSSPHDGEDGVDVVVLEAFCICDAGDVAEPEVLDHLVHGGARESRFAGVRRDLGRCVRARTPRGCDE